MSETERKEMDMEDEGLKEVMGSSFIDETVPLSEMPAHPQTNAYTTRTEKAAHSPANGPAKVFEKCTDCHLVKQRTWMDDLKDVTKSVAIFGGLNMLIFYWQQAGLVADSVAVPCTWVCLILAGIGVGEVRGVRKMLGRACK